MNYKTLRYSKAGLEKTSLLFLGGGGD